MLILFVQLCDVFIEKKTFNGAQLRFYICDTCAVLFMTVSQSYLQWPHWGIRTTNPSVIGQIVRQTLLSTDVIFFKKNYSGFYLLSCLMTALTILKMKLLAPKDRSSQSTRTC